MSSLLCITLALVSGFDIGGRVGGNFPAAGLETNHGSSALFGAAVGYTLGRSRFELGYAYSGLPGRQGSPYRLDLSDLVATYGFEYLRRPSWGFDASVGAGYSLVRRVLNAASESGGTPSAHLGLGFVQHQGSSRVSLGLDNCFFIQSAAAGSTRRVAIVYLFSIRAGVAYAF